MNRRIWAWARSALPFGFAALGIVSVTAVTASDLLAQNTPAASRTRARINGRVTDILSGQPLEGVNVIIVGTPIATTTGADGRFVIASAPVGIYSVEAKRLGYGANTKQNVRLIADSLTTLNFALNNNPLRLDAMTTSATVESTTGRNSTVDVARLGTTDMPVASTGGAAQMLQGKVAGVTMTRSSGAPGSEPNIVLRSPIGGVEQGGVPPSPLFVVDGVFLNAGNVGLGRGTGEAANIGQISTSDIEALDIESIEVLKGAAAAALYGSRAAAGVVAITTKRGKDLALGSTQFSVRSEIGKEQFLTNLEKNQYHNFLTNEKGEWINTAGNVVTRNNRVVKPYSILDSPFQVPTYNHPDQFYKLGTQNTQTATVQGNSAASNYTLSYSRTAQPGVIAYNDGFSRQTIRLNIDSRINEKLNLGMSASHLRSLNEPSAVNFANLYRIDPDINLLSVDPFPKRGFPYNIIPDSSTAFQNPLYSQYVADNFIKNGRTQININGRYAPLSWLSFNADASYDRADEVQTAYTARGIPVASGLGLALTTGSLQIFSRINDGMQVNAGPTLTKAFGDLTVRLTQRGEIQREVNPRVTSTGTDFSSEGLKAMSAARTQAVTQTYSDRRVIASLSNLGLTYGDKYIANGLIRREGSSLFGRANRWNTFFQVSGAWLMNEESWFPLQDFTTFKLRYAIGTAGQRPAFTDQYEAMTSDGVGGFTRGTSGNPELRPTQSREQEAGIDVTFKNRITGTFNYVTNKVNDVFNSIPSPATSGYNNVIANVATVTGNTMEATLQGQVLSNPNGLNWTVLATGSKSRSFLSRFGRTCFYDDGNGPLYKCEGTRVGEVWANRLVKDKSNLREQHAGSLDAFDVNDEGYVVAVGAGNTWRDGIAKGLWGTNVVVNDFTYPWGRPIIEIDRATGDKLIARAGDFNPDFIWGLNNTFRYKQARVYFQLTGQVGGNVYNNFAMATYVSADHEDVVQAGKSEETKKPVGYYNALADNNAGWMANFVDTGTHMNIAEVLVGYGFDAKQFPIMKRVGVSRIQADLVGRNLAILTAYKGLNVMGGNAFNRLDNALYPLTRSFTAQFAVTF
ncbi:MAG: SusC/RagA family TonB-linked outer membrane protein [Gemmatimonadota bacterium]